MQGFNWNIYEKRSPRQPRLCRIWIRPCNCYHVFLRSEAPGSLPNILGSHRQRLEVYLSPANHRGSAKLSTCLWKKCQKCRLVPQSHQSLAGDRQFYFSVLKTVKSRTFDFFVHILTIILCRLEYFASSANIHEHSLLP